MMAYVVMRRKWVRRGRRGRSVIAAMVLGVTAIIGLPLVANAYGSQGYGYMHTLGSGDLAWLGNYVMDGQYVYCAGWTTYPEPLQAGSYSSVVWYDGDAGASWTGSWQDSPVPTVPGSWYVWNSSHYQLRQSGADLNIANTSRVVQSGRTLTGANLNRIGYVLAVYGPTSNSDQAARMRMLIMEKFGVMYDSVWADLLRRPTIASNVANRQWIDSAWNAAIAYAGPYDTSATSVTVNAAQDGGTVENIGAYSEAGNLYSDGTAGWTATIVSANAAWDSNNGSTITGALTSSLQSSSFHVVSGGSGTVRILVTYNNLPDWRVGIRTSPTGEQPVMYGRRMALTETVVSDQPVRDAFLINIDTTTSNSVASLGETLTDQLVVTHPPFGGFWDPPGYAITATSTLYGPLASAPAPAPTVPVGTPVVGAVTTTLTGPGTYTTPGVVVSSPGYYVWHEVAPASGEFGGWSAQWGRPTEITLVPWTPTATTVLSDSIITPGGTVTDDVTVTGGQPSGSTNVRLDLYKHGDESPPIEGSIPVGSTLIDTATLPITFDATGGASTSTTFTIPGTEDPGYLTVVTTIEGTTEMTEWVSNYGISEETAVIQWVADPSTMAARSAGNIFTDDVTLVGLPTDYGLLADEHTPVTVDLFFVDRAFTGDFTTQCVDSNRIGTGTISARNGTVVARSREFDLPDFATPDMDGYYLFQISHPGSTRLAPFVAACGEPTETMFLVLTSFNRNDLATTGMNILPLLWWGAGLLVVGLFFVWLSDRSNENSALKKPQQFEVEY